MLQKMENALNALDLTHRKMPNVLRGKCIIAGDSTVGKSSLVQAFSSENSTSTFQKNYNMTCGVNICTKKVSIPDTDDAVELLLYDSSGKEIYSDMLMQLWQQPSMLCLVFDVTNQNSFNSCSEWLEAVKKVSDNLTVPGVLVGCKTDLLNRRTVPANVATEFAKKNNLCYFECSVKDKKGIEEPFFYLVNEWHKLYLDKMEFFKTVS